jgi:hypothetical protein
MKTQTPNAAQGNLGYREVLQNHDALSRQTKPTVKQIRNLIHMAKRCSKAPSLEKTKREQLQSIAATWKKFL